MKCAIHQDKDAIAVCQSCGNALCVDCRISLAGVSYCQTCLDAGRFRPPAHITRVPEEGPPSPLGVVTPDTRRNFAFGILGMIMLTVSIHILWMYPLFIPWFYSGPEYLLYIPRTVGLVLIAVGITFCGFAFGEFKNYFNYQWGVYLALFTMISPWLLVIGDLIIYTGLVFIQLPPYYVTVPGPLAQLYNIVTLVGWILIGILLILWAIALITFRNYMRSFGLTMAASGHFLIVAHLILLMIPYMAQFMFYPYSIIYILFSYFSVLHAIFLEPAAIITAILFYRLRASIKPS